MPIHDHTARKKTPQVAAAKKAAALKSSTAAPTLQPVLAAKNADHQFEAGLAPQNVQRQHDSENVHAPRGPPILESADDRFLTGPEVRARYSVSEMWVHRRLTDDSGFPKPDLIVNRRRFWRLSSLVRWEREWASGLARR